VVNASFNAGSIDVYMTSGPDITAAGVNPLIAATPVGLSGPPSGEDSTDIPGGTYQLTIATAGTKTVLFTGQLPCAFQRSASYTAASRSPTAHDATHPDTLVLPQANNMRSTQGALPYRVESDRTRAGIDRVVFDLGEIASRSDALEERPMDRSALPSGTRLGEMEILRVVAIGGFGIVYLARDHSLDRDVALKEFMPSQLACRSVGKRVTVRSISNAETFALGLQSFVNEAKLLARFSHPAMVKVYRFWEANGTAYMAMPYLRGPTLGDVRRSMSEPPTEVWLRSVIDPLLDALTMLHSEGFYHRDIAPDNVIVTGPGLPVLLDFGAARRLIGDRTQSLTAVLKPHYAPIEQYAETTRLRQGPWTDVYALAALIAYLLDGSPPPASTARSIHDEMDVLAQRHIDGVSRDFLAAVDWALAVKPQDRPQSVAELRDALNGRAVQPLANRAQSPTLPSDAAAAPSPRTAEPFPTTLRWSRPATLGKRLGVWPLVTAASILVAAALAWPYARPAATHSTLARSGLAVKSSIEPAVAAPVGEASAKAHDNIPAADLRDPAASPGTVTEGPSVQPTAPLLPIQRRTAIGPKVRGLGVHARTPSGQKAAHSREHAGTRAASAGPLELCADRNFFVRPYCIQRQCDEPRFKARPECMQARQLARARHE
jgi:serine/threonine protein kinase